MSFAQEDTRSSVQKLAASYIKRQEKELKEQQRLMGMYDYEGMFYDQGIYHVAGVDEVGRGPIAGPVTVAAVILPPMTLIPGLNDSKKLTEEKREALYDIKMCIRDSKNASSYVDTLKENFVMVDQDARRELISKQLHDIAASKNASIVWDDDLLEEINYLVEWPTALCGGFEESYLALPDACLLYTSRCV